MEERIRVRGLSLIFLLSALLVSWATGGCVASPVHSRVIAQHDDRFVRMDVTYRTGDDEHQHPTTVSHEHIASLLKTIRVKPQAFIPGWSGNAQWDIAFTPEQVEFLSAHLAKGLEQATPLEEVVFYWNEARDQNIREITSGSIYHENEAFHILLANYRWATSGTRDAQKVRTNPRLVLGESHYTLRVPNNGEASADHSWSMFRHPVPQHLIISHKDLLKLGSLKGVSEPLTVESRDNGPRSIKEQLQVLKDLRADGLISEEEFQQKKRTILENL